MPLSSLKAQNINIPDQYVSPTTTIQTHTNEVIHGSPFFNKKWEKGRVILKSDKKTKALPLKYKIYKNKLLFKKNDRKLAVNSNKIKGFILMQKRQKLLFKNGFKAPRYHINTNRIMEVIYDGQVKLLKKHNIQLMRGSRPDPISGQITSNFIKTEDYFLIDADGNFHKIKKLKRKYILSALRNHQKQLKKYVKSNNLSFKTQTDLKKILSHYDSLITSNNNNL
jgi:hypothetical protein